MLRSPRFWLFIYLLASLVLALVLVPRCERFREKLRAKSAASAKVATPERPSPEEAVVRPDDSATPGAAGARGALPAYTGPVNDRRRADLLREALTELVAGKLAAAKAASSASPAATAPKPPSTMPSPIGEGNQAEGPLGTYIGVVMQQQFVPLAGACYDQLLERRPNAQGKVVLDFSIMGDPSVGGVVVDVAFGKQTTLVDAEFATCTKESMLAVIFDAPPEGRAVVSVSQSFELSP